LIPNMSAMVEDFLLDINLLNGGSIIVWDGLIFTWI
jgi:hypothetical protein